MSTTLPRLDAITGAPLIGTWASSLLYMAEFLQAWYYFGSFKKDGWKLKSYVAVTLAIDTISAVGDYACVYLNTITHAGDLVYLAKQNWPMPLYIISTTSVAFFGSELPRLPFGAGLSTGLIVMLFPAVKDRNKIRISGTVWIVTQASADLIIAGVLVLELMRARVNNMLNRLVLPTIRTDTVTAVMAVLALIVFMIDEETNVASAMVYPLGRVYVLSMLINLNIREFSGRSQNARTTSGQRGTVRIAHGTTYNFTTGKNIVQSISATLRRQFLQTSIPVSQIAPTVDRSRAAYCYPPRNPPASIPETQPPEIEMVPADAEQIQEV
ncbi:hypothetical protein MSAN_00892200 [Mycena sanguinolenta]|uniref:DUF6534 domain-containing protein n=1 Tax=Mycena sanguinolenta TaxID=230812 RepID=A0A8H7DB77_9AGAR|nr:hypothetical protein MSAN_00892200 [Mycena sanguinolenta]